MIKNIKRFFWIFIIILQTFTGIIAGMLILSAVEVDVIDDNIKIGNLPVGGMSPDEAKNAIANYYADLIKQGTLVIEIDQKTFNLNYSELDLSVDAEKTLDTLKKISPQNGLDKLFYDSRKEMVIKPVFSYNSGKLLSKLESILSPFEKEPVTERYEIKDDALIFTPQIPGRKADYGLLELEVKKYLLSANNEPLRIDMQSAPIFAEVRGESLYKEKFTTIVSKAEIPISPELVEKVQSYIESFHGTVFEKGQEIKLSNLLDFSKFSSDLEKDLLNRIATGIYQSAISIEGIEIIHRRPSRQPVAYTEPGLEAAIEGEGADLILENGTDKPLMLLASVGDNSAAFYMVSTGELKSGILVVQKKDQVPPPVITSVNKELAPNQKKVIAEGIPGFTAYVSRIIDNDRVELYKDRYEPVSKIVETGEKPLLTGDK